MTTLLQAVAKSLSSIDTSLSQCVVQIRTSVQRMAVKASPEELIRVLEVVKQVETWSLQASSLAKVVATGTIPTNLTETLPVGKPALAKVRADPEKYVDDKSIAEAAPMRMAVLACLSLLGGKSTTTRLREEFESRRKLEPHQMRVLPGQNGIRSWEQAVANSLTRLKADDMIRRTAFGEYEITDKGTRSLKLMKETGQKLSNVRR